MVRFDKINLRYNGNFDVLNGINFKLEPGSFHFLTGPSGSGKSSLLKLMYLGHKPSSGEIIMFNKRLSLLPRSELPRLRRKIGVVFQDFRLLENLTAMENVALPLRVAGAKREQIEDHVKELLSWVGLDKRLNDLPNSLSDGEKQRIAIARAVIGRPNILLADEPTGSIDSTQGSRIMHLFQELNKIGTTIVVATHDSSMIKQFSYPELRISDKQIKLY
ncbi:cell division ATP-binding protein FtsE [Alphaproteobacteria bacterium]|nr:cell division ATP-binding protein FtsE [Alphaproteobacteria bacterium]